MLRLPVFEYHQPATLQAAAQLLHDLPEAMLVAGGTDLLPSMKRELFSPKHLVGLGHLGELSYVRTRPDGALCIGAGTRLDALVNHPSLKDYAALATAARSISTPQLRNMGTLGGNICLDTRCSYYNQSLFWRQALGYCMKKGGDVCRVAGGSPTCIATFSADTVPALIALGAEVSLVSANGIRDLRLEDLYRNDGLAFLNKERDEILAEIRVPPRGAWRSSYWKLRDRESIDFPIAGLAIAIDLTADGEVGEARVATTGIFPAPLRLRSVERVLQGQRLTEDVIAAAAEAGYREAHPVENTSGSIVQRKSAVRVFIQRALEEMQL